MKKLYIIVFALSLLLCSCTKRDFSDEFNPKTDNQYFFSQKIAFAQDDSNYYFIGAHNSYLTMTPKNGNEAVIVCNKPDCLHDKETDGTKTALCNALVMDNSCKLQYSGGKLYIKGDLDYQNPAQQNPNFYEFNIDGSGYKEIIKPEKYATAFAVHRGYLYAAHTDFTSGEDNINAEKLKDMSFYIAEYNLANPSAKPKIIYQKKGSWGQLSELVLKGKYLYASGLTTPEIGGESVTTTLAINLQSKEVYERTDLYANLAFAKDKLLSFSYDSGFDLNAFLQPNKSAELLNADLTFDKTIAIPYGSFYSTDGLIACDNLSAVLYDITPREERSVTFYTPDGKKLCETLTNADIMPEIGMNDEYYFYTKRKEDNSGLDIYKIPLTGVAEGKSAEPQLFFSYEATTPAPSIITGAR